MTLEGEGLVVAREGRRILDGASVRVPTGALVAIEGPSGSGKSTLLRVLATLVEPDAGVVRLDGIDARTIPPPAYRTRVAYVPQEPPMVAGTVAANVGLGPSFRGEAMEALKIEGLLAQVGLTADFAGREARSLSGGEKARVALARALANRPEVLLLDEPTASLDPATGEQVVGLLRGLGVAVLMVTHVPEHALALGGTRVRCEAGRVLG